MKYNLVNQFVYNAWRPRSAYDASVFFLSGTFNFVHINFICFHYIFWPYFFYLGLLTLFIPILFVFIFWPHNVWMHLSQDSTKGSYPHHLLLCFRTLLPVILASPGTANFALEKYASFYFEQCRRAACHFIKVEKRTRGLARSGPEKRRMHKPLAYRGTT
jgi:hypothetical protein